MSATTTKVRSIAAALDAAAGGELNTAMQLLKLGTMLTPIEEDTGTITGVSAIKLKNVAAVITSARVLTSGTATSVGTYMCGDSAVTPLLPPGGASTAIGIASLGTDSQTITFPNTVTRVIVRYLPMPDLTAAVGVPAP